MLTPKDRLILAHWTKSCKAAWHRLTPYAVLALFLALFVPGLCLAGLIFLAGFPLLALACLIDPLWGRLFGGSKHPRTAVSKHQPPLWEIPNCHGAEGVDLVSLDCLSEEERGQVGELPLLGVACPDGLTQGEFDALSSVGTVDCCEDPYELYCVRPQRWDLVTADCDGGGVDCGVILDCINVLTQEEWQAWQLRQVTLAARREEVERMLSLPAYKGSKGHAQLRRDAKAMCGLDKLPNGTRHCLASMISERKYPLD